MSAKQTSQLSPKSKNLWKFLSVFFLLVFVQQPFVFAQVTLADFQGVAPLDVEGVYDADAPPLDKSGTIPTKFTISIIQSPRTGSLNVTISSQLSRMILFFASQVSFQRSSDIIEVQSFGVNFRGVRQHMIFQIDPGQNTIVGEISANFLENTSMIVIRGKKVESIVENEPKYESTECGNSEDYLGTFKGTFGYDESAELHIIPVKTATGEEVLTANIASGIKHLFHDGYFSKEERILSLVNDIIYPMNGRLKKLLMYCDQNETHWILKGVHVASSGQIVRKIVFKKKKEDL